MARTELRWAQVRDSSITEVDILLSDNTLLDTSTSQHGLLPKLPTATWKILSDDLTWKNRFPIDYIWVSETVSILQYEQYALWSILKNDWILINDWTLIVN